MVTMEQFKLGAINYIEAELLPLMTGWKRIAAATYVALAADNVEEMLMKAKDNPMVSILGVFDDKGMINEDRLHKALYTQMSASGDITVPIPVIGEFNFNKSDVDKLMQHIKKGRML